MRKAPLKSTLNSIKVGKKVVSHTFNEKIYFIDLKVLAFVSFFNLAKKAILKSVIKVAEVKVGSKIKIFNDEKDFVRIRNKKLSSEEKDYLYGTKDFVASTVLVYCV